MEADDDQKKKRKRRFYLVRVSILLLILFVVVLYAVRDVWSRHARNEWKRTLDVVVVLVHVSKERNVDPAAVALLKERAPALEARLAEEAARLHYAGTEKNPVRIKVVGPVEVASPPPTPESNSPVDLAKQTVNMKSWLAAVDPAAGVVTDHWDTRIYVSIRQPASEARSFVEGSSEQDGRIGAVDVELAPDMVDLTLFVVAHELMHTLGATDKYDSNGRALMPDGFAEPRKVPLYPQRFAEVMARNLPMAPNVEAPPETLDELAIGEVTAKEIGWLR